MIESTSNKHVKEVVKLQSKRSYRYKQGTYVIEGWRMIGEAPSQLLQVIYVAESALVTYKGGLEALSVPWQVVSDQVMAAMSQEMTNQGILALIAMPKVQGLAPHGEGATILALDQVQDPGNLGTILRTALAAGVRDVYLSEGTVDVYNPKVVKATMGAIYHLNLHHQVDLPTFLQGLKETGYQVGVTYLEGGRPYDQVNLSQPTCLVMGNEGNGVSQSVLELADERIIIPMDPKSESLNVAIATAIVLFEANRQKSNEP